MINQEWLLINLCARQSNHEKFYNNCFFWIRILSAAGQDTASADFNKKRLTEVVVTSQSPVRKMGILAVPVQVVSINDQEYRFPQVAGYIIRSKQVL